MKNDTLGGVLAHATSTEQADLVDKFLDELVNTCEDHDDVQLQIEAIKSILSEQSKNILGLNNNE